MGADVNSRYKNKVFCFTGGKEICIEWRKRTLINMQVGKETSLMRQRQSLAAVATLRFTFLINIEFGTQIQLPGNCEINTCLKV